MLQHIKAMFSMFLSENGDDLPEVSGGSTRLIKFWTQSVVSCFCCYLNAGIQRRTLLTAPIDRSESINGLEIRLYFLFISSFMCVTLGQETFHTLSQDLNSSFLGASFLLRRRKVKVVEFLRHPKSEVCHFSSVVWNSQTTPLRSQGALEKECSDMAGTPSGSSLCVKGEAISGEQAPSLS